MLQHDYEYQQVHSDIHVQQQLESLHNQFHQTRFGFPEHDDNDNDVSTMIEKLFCTISNGCHCNCVTVNSHKDCEEEILSIVNHVNEYNHEIDSILLESYSIIKDIFDSICLLSNGNKYCCLNEVAILLKCSFKNIVLCYLFAIESKIDEYYVCDKLSNNIYQQSIVNRIIILRLLNKWYEYKHQSKFFDKYFKSCKDTSNKNKNNVQFFNERIESYYTYLVFSFEWLWDIFYSMFKMFDISVNKNLRFNYNCIKILEIFNDIIFDFRQYTKIFLVNKRYRKYSQTQSFLWIDILQLDPNVYSYFLFENMILCNLLRYACDDVQEKEKKEKKEDENDKNEGEKKRNVMNQMFQVIQSLEQKVLIVKREYFKLVNTCSILNTNSDTNNRSRWIEMYPTIFNIWQCMLNSTNTNHVCLLLFLTHIFHCIVDGKNSQDATQVSLYSSSQNVNTIYKNVAIDITNISNNSNTKTTKNGNNSKSSVARRYPDNNNSSDFKTEYKEDKDWDNLYDFRIFTRTNNVNFIVPINDPLNDVLIFQSHHAIIYRQQTETRSIWSQCGCGKMFIFYNKERKILRLEFLDVEHKKIRLSQTFYPYFDYNMICKQNANNNECDSIIWLNTDYATHETVTGLWKLTILSQTEAIQDVQRQRQSKCDKIVQIEFLNIVKDFYFGFGLPQWIEHSTGCKYGNIINTKPNDYIWEKKKKIQQNTNKCTDEIEYQVTLEKLNNSQRHLKQIYLLMMHDFLQYIASQQQEQEKQHKDEESKNNGGKISSCQTYHFGDSLRYNVKLLIKYLFNYIYTEYQRVKYCRKERELIQKFSCAMAQQFISMIHEFNCMFTTIEKNWDYVHQHGKFLGNNDVDNFCMFKLSLNCNNNNYNNYHNNSDNNCKWSDIIFQQLIYDQNTCHEGRFNCHLCKYIQEKRQLRKREKTAAKEQINAKAKEKQEKKVSMQTQKCESISKNININSNTNKYVKKSSTKKKNRKQNKNKINTTHTKNNENCITGEGLLKSFMQFTKTMMNSNVNFSNENDIINNIAAAVEISKSTSKLKNNNKHKNKNRNKNNRKHKHKKKQLQMAKQPKIVNTMNTKTNNTKQSRLNSSIDINTTNINLNLSGTSSKTGKTSRPSDQSNTIKFCLNDYCKLRVELCYWWCMLHNELAGNIATNEIQGVLVALERHIDVFKSYIPNKWKISSAIDLNNNRNANTNGNDNIRRRINLNGHGCNNNILDFDKLNFDGNGSSDSWFIDSNWFEMNRNKYFYSSSKNIPCYSNCLLQLMFGACVSRKFNSDYYYSYNPDWSQLLIRNWILPHLVLKIKLVVKAKMYDKALNEIDFILKYIDSNNQFALQWKPNVIYCLQKQSYNYKCNDSGKSIANGSNINHKCLISPQCLKMTFTKASIMTTKTNHNSKGSNVTTNITNNNGGKSQDDFCFPVGASITPTPEPNVLALFGGINKNTNQFANNLWTINVNKRKSTLLSNGRSINITPRFNHSAHLISNRKLCIIGGQFANYNLYQRYHDMSLRNQLTCVKLNRNNGCDDRLLCNFDFKTKKWHIPQNVFLLHDKDVSGNVQLGSYVNATNSDFLNSLFLDVHCTVQLNSKEIYVFSTHTWNNFVLNIENGTTNSRSIIKWTQLPKIFDHGDSSFKNENEFIISMNALYSIELEQIILIETSNYLHTRIIFLDPSYAKGNIKTMKLIQEDIDSCNDFVCSARKLTNAPWIKHVKPAFRATIRDDESIDDCLIESESNNNSWNDYSSLKDYSMRFSELCPKFDAILFDTRYFMINKNYDNIKSKSERANREAKAKTNPKYERNFKDVIDIKHSKIDKQYDYDCEKLWISYQDYNYILKKLDKMSDHYKKEEGFDLMDYHNQPTRVSILFHVVWTQKYDNFKTGDNRCEYQYQRKRDFFMFNLLFYKANRPIKYTEQLGAQSIWRCGCNFAMETYFSSHADWWNIDFTPKCLQQERFPNAMRNQIDNDNCNNLKNIALTKNRFMLLNNTCLILLDEKSNFRFLGLKRDWMYYILNYGRMYRCNTVLQFIPDVVGVGRCNATPLPHLLTKSFTNIDANDRQGDNTNVKNNFIGDRVGDRNTNKNKNTMITFKVVANQVETVIICHNHVGKYNTSIRDDFFENRYNRINNGLSNGYKPSLYHLINYDSSRLIECSYCHGVELNPIYFKRCDKCNICIYCSSLCQQLHWNQCHSKYCKQIDKFKYKMNIANIKSKELLIKHGSRFGYKVGRNDIRGINSLFINESKKNGNENTNDTGMSLITEFLHRQETEEREMKMMQKQNNENDEESVQKKIDKLCQQIERSLLLTQKTKTSGKKKKIKKKIKSKRADCQTTNGNDTKQSNKNRKKKKKKKKRQKRRRHKMDNEPNIKIVVSDRETESQSELEDDSKHNQMSDSDTQIEGKGESDVQQDNDDDNDIDDDTFQIEILNLPLMTKECDIANIFNVDLNNVELIDNKDNIKCVLNLDDIQSIMQISIYHKKYQYRLSKECIIKHLFVSDSTIDGLKEKYLSNLENKQQDFNTIFMLFKLCGVLTHEAMILFDN